MLTIEELKSRGIVLTEAEQVDIGGKTKQRNPKGLGSHKYDLCECGASKRACAKQCRDCFVANASVIMRERVRLAKQEEAAARKRKAICTLCHNPHWSIFEWCGIDLCAKCAYEMAKRKVMDDAYLPAIEVIE